MKIRSGVSFLGVTGVALAALAVASCGNESEAVWTDESGLLKYIPADTPYLFASGNTLPADLAEKLQPWTDRLMATYSDFLHGLLDDAVRSGALVGDSPQTATNLLEIADELFTPEGRENAGFGPDSKFVFFGNGLLPVMRMTLTDGEKLEATVARVEAAAGEAASVATSGSQSYRWWGDENVRVVLAIIDDEVVLTASPTTLMDQHLVTAFGSELPANNIAASGRLDTIATKYAFGPHYLGFLDSERIASTFLDEQTGINAALLDYMEYDSSTLSAVCKSEIRDMVGIAPLGIFGTTAMDAQQIGMNAIVELRPDIAAGLATIPAAVPGLGTLRAGIMSLGLGMDMRAVRDFLMARLDAMAADPYQCEMLAGASAGVPQLRATLNQPLPPQADDINGLVLAIDDIGEFDLAQGQMPMEISARLLIASDNAPGLVAMGAMFSPEIASLQPDGEPVRINLPIPMPVPVELHAALSQTAVAIALGPGGMDRVRELLNAPSADSRPFMAGDLDYNGYYELMNAATQLGLWVTPAAAPGVTMPTLPTEQLMSVLADSPFDREVYDVRFTANGIEMPATVTLKD